MKPNENINEEVKEQQMAAEEPNVEAQETEAAEPEKEPTAEELLQQKLDEQTLQLAAMQDKYLRSVADFDNYRKRMIKEKQDAFDYANTAILTDLVAILDDFDRGLAAAAEETLVEDLPS